MSILPFRFKFPFLGAFNSNINRAFSRGNFSSLATSKSLLLERCSNSLGIAASCFKTQSNKSSIYNGGLNYLGEAGLTEQGQFDPTCRATNFGQVDQSTLKNRGLINNSAIQMQKGALSCLAKKTVHQQSAQKPEVAPILASFSRLKSHKSDFDSKGSSPQYTGQYHVSDSSSEGGVLSVSITNPKEHPAYSLTQPGTFIDSLILQAWGKRLQEINPNLLMADPTRLSKNFIDDIFTQNTGKLTPGQWMCVPVNCCTHYDDPQASDNKSGNHWILCAVRYSQDPKDREFLVFDSLQTQRSLQQKIRSSVGQSNNKIKFISGDLQEKRYPNGCGVLVAKAMQELAIEGLDNLDKNPHDILLSFHNSVGQSNQQPLAEQRARQDDLNFRSRLQRIFYQSQSDLLALKNRV